MLLRFTFTALLMVIIISPLENQADVKNNEFPQMENPAKHDEDATVEKAANVSFNHASHEEESELQTGDCIEGKEIEDAEIEFEKQTLEAEKEIKKTTAPAYTIQLENGQQPLIIVIPGRPQENHDITLRLVIKDGEAQPKPREQAESQEPIQPTSWPTLFQVWALALVSWVIHNATEILKFITQWFAFWERYNRRNGTA